MNQFMAALHDDNMSREGVYCSTFMYCVTCIGKVNSTCLGKHVDCTGKMNSTCVSWITCIGKVNSTCVS